MAYNEILGSYEGRVDVEYVGNGAGWGEMIYRVTVREYGVYVYVYAHHTYLKTLTISYGSQSITFQAEGNAVLEEDSYAMFTYEKYKGAVTFSGTNISNNGAIRFRDPSGNYSLTSFTVGENITNRAPSATIYVPTLFAGRGANVSWSTSDPDGDTVYTVSLVRYMRRPGQASFVATTLISSETTVTSYDDFIPSDAGGAEIYYYLGFTDKYTSTQYKQSGTAAVYTNTPPTAPGSIVVSGDIAGVVATGGGTVTVSWAQSSDVDGNLSGYELERQESGGAWRQIYRGGLREYTTTVTEGTTSLRFRVRAYDTMGEYSAYTTGSSYTVNNNKAPKIAVSNIVTDGSIGVFNQATGAPEINYTVTDPEGTVMQVSEYLDGVLLRQMEAASGSTFRISFDAAAWLQVLNGVHVVRIAAVDADGSAGSTEIRFTKDVDVIEVHLKSAMESESDKAPTLLMVNIQGLLPTGCILHAEACNNANDAAPTWEDITNAVLNREKHIFHNTQKTAEKWAVSLRVKLERGEAESTCAITSIGGNWK